MKKSSMTSILIVVAVVAIGMHAAAQQQSKIARIGMLVSGSASTHGSRIDAFRGGLRELGYVEGKNIFIEYRYAEGKRERFADLAVEMVRLKPDVIYVGSTGFASAAKKATSTIPIVATGGDLIGAGLAASLAQPGGNLTGSTNISPDVSGKRLELLKESVPKAKRVAVLYHPNPSDEEEVEQSEIAARALGLAIYRVPVKAPGEFAAAFSSMRKENATALVLIQGSVNNSHIKTLAEYAVQNANPCIGESPDYAENGCLMSYGPNLNDLWYRGAIFVDKILKARKPADLPIEQPIEFELVFNLKTAKQIGLTIPPNVLVRANRVIK